MQNYEITFINERFCDTVPHMKIKDFEISLLNMKYEVFILDARF